jgi:putative tricarboxylic transport membrane protein
VLGLVLGPLAELQFRRALAISEGDATVFVTRPLCAALFGLSALALILPVLLKERRA